MADLFRQEAINHASRRLDGDVMVGTAVSWTVLGYVFAGIAAAALVFASLATYSRKESVTGWVVPHGGIIRVAARDGGVVEAIPVREGMTVSVGDTLARIRLSTDTTNGDTGAILEKTARSEITATDLNARAQLEKIRADSAQLQTRRDALVSMRDEAANTLKIQQGKADLARANLQRAQQLFDKGYLSQQSLDVANASLLSARQDVSSAQTSLLSLDQQLADVQSQIRATPILVAQAQTLAQSNSAALTQKLQQIKAGNEYTLTAPIAGKVMALPAELGQTVPTGGVVMVLTPQNSHLEAELFVPSRAAGFIRPGQDVSLQYQAFPYQKFGSHRGKVISVSRTVLAPGEVSISGLSLSEPVFRVRVALQQDFVQAYGARTPLQPGMLANADIIIDRRSLIEWLLDPIYAVGKRG